MQARNQEQVSPGPPSWQRSLCNLSTLLNLRVALVREWQTHLGEGQEGLLKCAWGQVEDEWGPQETGS